MLEPIDDYLSTFGRISVQAQLKDNANNDEKTMINEILYQRERKQYLKLVRRIPSRDLVQWLIIVLFVLLRFTPFSSARHHIAYDSSSFLVRISFRDIEPFGFQGTSRVVLNNEPNLRQTHENN